MKSGRKSCVLQDSSHHKSMKIKQYFKQTAFPLMGAPGVNFISKFLGAEIVRGQRLIEGCTYCIGRELNHIKFQNWLWAF